MKEKYRLLNQLRKMRLLWLNLLCVLACVVYGVQAGDISNVKLEGGFTKDNYKKEITKLIQTEINQSLKYLYTGVGYGNQMIEKPGMATFLRSMSDARWEEAIDTLKKYVARGGAVGDIMKHKHYSFEGKNQLDMESAKIAKDHRAEYLQTLEGIHHDSLKISAGLNKIHEMTQTARDGHHDGDWSHFAEERLEEEVKRSRKLSGDVTTLSQMADSAIGFHIFDSHLT